ncbi:hypothetical protein FHS25_005817 [Rhizobium laguerreae]|uniref:Uncharacterized protein n=1 Tax=Rhizobium laguerreae TaxID=1076926 RepID=A0ABR6GG97_9HYPH|nr:hypothetical protein [Rhizobium laguerreae]
MPRANHPGYPLQFCSLSPMLLMYPIQAEIQAVAGC